MAKECTILPNPHTQLQREAQPHFAHSRGALEERPAALAAKFQPDPSEQVVDAQWNPGKFNASRAFRLPAGIHTHTHLRTVSLPPNPTRTITLSYAWPAGRRAPACELRAACAPATSSDALATNTDPGSLASPRRPERAGYGAPRRLRGCALALRQALPRRRGQARPCHGGARSLHRLHIERTLPRTKPIIHATLDIQAGTPY